ncbi:putative ATPase/DNA-binding winged helix-turn-helix (wHTH) protein [Paraburkholderia atlantica]
MRHPGLLEGRRIMYVFDRVAVSLDGRQVFRDGQAQPIGARAFDILELLIRSAGKLVTKDEIMRLVWPTTFVVENNIQVHISALRKLFGDGWIRTVPGRGYQLRTPSQMTAPHAPSQELAAKAVAGVVTQRSWPLVGRDDDANTLYEMLQRGSLVTVSGPGGVGKTRLALSVARAWADSNHFQVCHVDFAGHSTQHSCLLAVLEILGGAAGSNAPTIADVVQTVGDRQIVLVFDNCERVLQAVASLCECIAASNGHAVILTTSREPLRAMGERVHSISPLTLPEENAGEAETLASGAISMFFEHARASGIRFPADPGTLNVIADICRRLGGLPLAIELAVARAALLGVQGLLRELEKSILWLSGGLRTAHPRQKTLRATVEWSYSLLSEPECAVLRRLAVFPRTFNLAGACDVISCADIGRDAALTSVLSLAKKSLLTLHTEGPVKSYSLLPVERAYAIERLMESGEWPCFRSRYVSSKDNAPANFAS